jgi:hypothetical protein
MCHLPNISLDNSPRSRAMGRMSGGNPGAGAMAVLRFAKLRRKTSHELMPKRSDSKR